VALQRRAGNVIGPRRWSSAGLAALVVLLGAMLSVQGHVRINWTDSLPRGLYLVAPVPADGLARGQLVVACPPATYAAVGRAHHYLLLGKCAGGVAPLLKIVAARSGDVVVLRSAGIRVNGKSLPQKALLVADHTGNRPMHITLGTYRVAANHIWLFTPKDDGYGSRYFGAVATADVFNVARPLFTIGRDVAIIWLPASVSVACLTAVHWRVSHF